MAADDLLDDAGGDEDVLQQLLQLFQSQPAVRQHFQAAMSSLLNKLLCIFRSCLEICNNFSQLGENVDICFR
jgi:type III secretory pathway component EscT